MRQAQVLDDRAVRKVLEHVAGRPFAARNRCMFCFSWLAGMRVGEIAALNASNVITADGEIRSQSVLAVDQTKGKEARTVLFNRQMQAEIASYLQQTKRPFDEPLFLSSAGERFSPNSLCQVFGRIYSSCGLDAATSHSGRRTFITTLAHKGVGVRVLAALAGHKHIGTTQRYIDLNENVMREAVELI